MNQPDDTDEELITFDKIEARIYYLRGKSVMLDSDLADVYVVEARVLNQAVKRNINRFPEDFMFQLTDDEFMGLRSSSQFVASSRK